MTIYKACRDPADQGDLAQMTSIHQFYLRTQPINLKQFFRRLVYCDPLVRSLCPFADSRASFVAG
ncbi:hypothetical protein C5689_00265 [Methylosinus sporium]|uniref:Uncharacterized protein n=1 Tax=Methylosinus sporium TaxID=428 RepID=A0A2U1SVF0_METSR|nr:hypothetical protein C5689_00265 [Methylosinus sporium]